MLPQATLASIAGILKIDVTALKAAIEHKDEVAIKVKVKDAAGKETEADFDPAVLQSFTKDELTARDENVKSTVKDGYQNAGRELAIKTIKEKAGLEFEGKDPLKLLEKLSEKISADLKIPADKRVTELQEQLRLLKADGETGTGKVADLEKQLSSAKREVSILSSLPARNDQIPDEDYLVLLRNKITVDVVDGKEVYKDAKGEVLRDPASHAPLDLKGSLKKVWETNPAWAPLDTSKGGRGGGNSGAGGAGGSGDIPTKYSEAIKVWQGKGKNINDADFATWLGSLKEKNKDFDMDLQNAVNDAIPAATT